MEEAVNPAAPAEPAGFPFPQPRTWVRRNERKTERNIRKGVISRRRHPFRGRAARAMSGCCDDSAAGSEDFEGHEKVAPATGPLPACARALSRTDAKPPQPDSPAPGLRCGALHSDPEDPPLSMIIRDWRRTRNSLDTAGARNPLRHTNTRSTQQKVLGTRGGELTARNALRMASSSRIWPRCLKQSSCARSHICETGG